MAVWGWFIISQVWLVGLIIMVAMSEYAMAIPLLVGFVYCLFNGFQKKKDILKEVENEG